ncbi:hypothetical protein C1G86_1116 [Dehalococcoides mccartyi]|jgi:hypothetical protein|uniref:Uncharacterized protein n=1 Tax=Dehalococcoides mccartyi TaxID=61435 RepID=A0A328ENK2_9CHLR|nr:hypothetical protein C1G87_1082 [Dehalococcoides mccartyi]RAL70242.1 hypothetical protein C1G86_1116 [Dehalococcoides mccartyi]
MGTTLIASVTTGRGITEYRKVLTADNNIFRQPDNLDKSAEYNPATLLEDNGWYGLERFSDKPYCFEFLQQGFSSVDYDAINRNDFGKIVFLCGYQDELFFFQRVTPTRQVNRKRIVFFGESCKYEESSTSISLNEYPDAIYNSDNNTLYFRKLRNISTIFDGIDELYREATEDEVKYFLDHQFIELTEDFASDNVMANNRKRIAMALETLKHLSVDEREVVFKYIKDYYPELANGNNKFNIHNEDSLKKLLYGIEQRYYTTPIGDERRLANSIIRINQGGQI